MRDAAYRRRVRRERLAAHGNRNEDVLTRIVCGAVRSVVTDHGDRIEAGWALSLAKRIAGELKSAFRLEPAGGGGVAPKTCPLCSMSKVQRLLRCRVCGGKLCAPCYETHVCHGEAMRRHDIMRRMAILARGVLVNGGSAAEAVAWLDRALIASRDIDGPTANSTVNRNGLS